MTRKAAWCGLPFLAGTALWCAFGKSFGVLVICIAVISALGAFIFREYRVYAAAVGASVICGLLAGKAYALLRIEPALALDGKTVTAEGTVKDCRVISGGKCMLTVEGEAEGTAVTFIAFAEGSFEPYITAEVSGTLKALEDTPSFPSESYYLPKGICLQMSDAEVRETGRSANFIMRGVTELRDYTAKCLTAYMDADSAAFAEAAFCGDKSDLNEVTKAEFYRAGIGHLFALSGTHLAVTVMILSTIFRTVIRRRRAASVLLGITVLLFTAFGGFSPSLVRAGIMALLICCSQLAGRRTDVLNSLGLCAAVMCGANPYACCSASFICSFTCCFALGTAVPKFTALIKQRGLAGALLRALAASAVITVFIMPVGGVLFNEVSLIAPLTSLLTVPLFTAAMVLTVLAMLMGGTVLPAQLLLRLADRLIKLILWLAEKLSSFGASAVGCRRLWLIIGGAVLLGAGLFLAVRRGRAAVFAVSSVCVFSLMWGVQSAANFIVRDEVRVKVFSDGRGCCAVISCGGSCSLIDIGAKGSFGYSVQQYLSYNGIRRCRTAFVMQDLGASVYRDGFLPAFEDIRTEYGSFSEPFSVGMTADMGSYTVSRTADGYYVSAFGETVSLSAKRIGLSGGRYIPAEEMKKYPELTLG